MEQNNQLPAQLSLPPQQVNRQVIEAIFNTELVRRNYLKIIQSIQGIVVTRENIKEVYALAKEVEHKLNELDTVRKSLSDPYMKAQKEIKAAFDDATLPVKSEVTRILSDVEVINKELSAEKAEAQAKIDRYNKIQLAMKDFVNRTTVLISLAPDDATLVNIQKRIGSEKSKASFYGDLMDEFRAMCEPLTSLINDRKESIRKAAILMAEQRQAIQSGNLERATDIKEELELIDAKMEENSLRIQEAAFNSVAGTSIVVAEPDITTIKGTVRRWKWRVDNVELLSKKMPHLTKLEPNKEAIEQLLAEKRKDGSLEGKTELTFFGLTFYHHEFL